MALSHDATDLAAHRNLPIILHTILHLRLPPLLSPAASLPVLIVQLHISSLPLCLSIFLPFFTSFPNALPYFILPLSPYSSPFSVQLSLSVFPSAFLSLAVSSRLLPLASLYHTSAGAS